MPSSDGLGRIWRCGSAVTPAEQTTALIRGRAERLRRPNPDLAGLIDAYVARQEHEVGEIERGFVCATWVLRRA